MNRRLREVLEGLTDTTQVPELAEHLLHGTTLHVGRRLYAITEFEVYLDDDPYTHRDELQVSTTCQWYFHRSHGKKYRGGTFKGLDITCGPPGKAGGILIRAVAALTSETYVDGPCKVVDALLGDLEARSIDELVKRPEFDINVFSEGVVSLKASSEHCFVSRHTGLPTTWIGYATAIRVGLSNAHPAFRTARLRVLSLPGVRSTRKYKGDVLRALVEDYGVENAATITGKSVKQLLPYKPSTMPLRQTGATDTTIGSVTSASFV